MSVNKDKICKILDAIASCQVDLSIDISSIQAGNADERNIVLGFLMFYGVIQIDGDQFKLASNSAKLFIKSISEYMRLKKPLVTVWNDREHVSSEINGSNVFLSSNFLKLIETSRKNAVEPPEVFKPIFEGATVRAAIVRKVWGHKRYLMQYSERVGKYQLIGGMFLNSDQNHKSAMIRKLKEETPGLIEASGTPELSEIFQSQREDEEIFFSNRNHVYARYKTYIYSLRFKEPLTKKTLKDIAQYANNRWVTMKEIDRGRAKDGREIFPLEPNAIAGLKKLEPNIRVKSHDIGLLLEETWVKVVMAIATLSGITAVGVLTKFFSWILHFFSGN